MSRKREARLRRKVVKKWISRKDQLERAHALFRGKLYTCENHGHLWKGPNFDGLIGKIHEGDTVIYLSHEIQVTRMNNNFTPKIYAVVRVIHKDVVGYLMCGFFGKFLHHKFFRRLTQ